MKTFPAIQRLTLPVIMLLAVLCLLQPAAANVEEKAKAPTPAPSPITTVYLVRHAEKAEIPNDNNPPLNEMGLWRSQVLAHMLGKAEIKAIYTSQYQRTQQTAKPLAAKLGVTPTVVPITMSPSNPRELSSEYIRAMINNIHQRAGESVLVVGHTNTIPRIISALRAGVIPVIDEQTFDNLFIVTMHNLEVAKVVQLKY